MVGNCCVCRLLSFLDSAVSSGPLCCWGSPFPSQDQSHYVHEAMQLLRGGFKVWPTIGASLSSVFMWCVFAGDSGEGGAV